MGSDIVKVYDSPSVRDFSTCDDGFDQTSKVRDQGHRVRKSMTVLVGVITLE